MPEVSVIMPAYNAERYIGEAIESVLSQTWRDWELIVIDDGSTDRTPEILDGFRDMRIKKIRQDNLGEAGARNRGLDSASGELIAMLDADDIFCPNALADFVDFMRTHDHFGVAFSDGYMITADKSRLMTLTEHRPGIYQGNVLEQVVLSGSVVTVPSCTVTRRCIVEANKIRFDVEQGFGTDRLFWIDLARATLFGYIDQITCMYRIHETNMNRMLRLEERREAAIRMRLKVINSGWFRELTLGTRSQVFHGLLADLLHGQPERQRAILAAGPFLALPGPQRAHLYRMVATSYLLAGQEPGFARICLQQASTLCPGDRKSRLLLRLFELSPALCALTLSTWHQIHEAGKSIRAVGKRKAKPVPAALRQPSLG